jgi:tetratricopeptide (TPR) repeat protein
MAPGTGTPGPGPDLGHSPQNSAGFAHFEVVGFCPEPRSQDTVPAGDSGRQAPDRFLGARRMGAGHTSGASSRTSASRGGRWRGRERRKTSSRTAGRAWVTSGDDAPAEYAQKKACDGMDDERVLSLGSVRADGWFERVGQNIASFEALCDILGARFFAFSMITGTQVTALTVDRRNPDNTLVRFTVGQDEQEEAQELLLGEFRLRLVNLLAADEASGPAPSREEDTEALQLFIGVRTLLLAPLFGYAFESCRIRPRGVEVVVSYEGAEYVYELAAFRARLRMHVREELREASRGRNRSTIDLARVADARVASERGDYLQVLDLLGSWPAPLSIFLRTPEGQLISAEQRSSIAEALALLGNACVRLGEFQHGEEVLRLAVQYATLGSAAADAYLFLGQALMEQGRPAEAVAPLRRATTLGAPAGVVLPLLARAWLDRGRYLAALAAVLEARAIGSDDESAGPMLQELDRALGAPLVRWRELIQRD